MADEQRLIVLLKHVFAPNARSETEVRKAIKTATGMHRQTIANICTANHIAPWNAAQIWAAARTTDRMKITDLVPYMSEQQFESFRYLAGEGIFES